MGEILEVSDSYVSRMETGDKIPDVAMVIKIAGFFEAGLNQLLRDELVLAGESRRLIVKVRRLVYCRVGDLIWGALRDGCRRN